MRARDLIFHVTCFSCALCGLPLAAGDTAGIRGGRVFCCEHYETELKLLVPEPFIFELSYELLAIFNTGKRQTFHSNKFHIIHPQPNRKVDREKENLFKQTIQSSPTTHLNITSVTMERFD